MPIVRFDPGIDDQLYLETGDAATYGVLRRVSSSHSNVTT